MRKNLQPVEEHRAFHVGTCRVLWMPSVTRAGVQVTAASARCHASTLYGIQDGINVPRVYTSAGRIRDVREPAESNAIVWLLQVRYATAADTPTATPTRPTRELDAKREADVCNARRSGIREAAVLNMVDKEEMVEVEVKG